MPISYGSTEDRESGTVRNIFTSTLQRLGVLPTSTPNDALQRVQQLNFTSGDGGGGSWQDPLVAEAIGNPGNFGTSSDVILSGGYASIPNNPNFQGPSFSSPQYPVTGPLSNLPAALGGLNTAAREGGTYAAPNAFDASGIVASVWNQVDQSQQDALEKSMRDAETQYSRQIEDIQAARAETVANYNMKMKELDAAAADARERYGIETPYIMQLRQQAQAEFDLQMKELDLQERQADRQLEDAKRRVDTAAVGHQDMQNAWANAQAQMDPMLAKAVENARMLIKGAKGIKENRQKTVKGIKHTSEQAVEAAMGGPGQRMSGAAAKEIRAIVKENNGLFTGEARRIARNSIASLKALRDVGVATAQHMRASIGRAIETQGIISDEEWDGIERQLAVALEDAELAREMVDLRRESAELAFDAINAELDVRQARLDQELKSTLRAIGLSREASTLSVNFALDALVRARVRAGEDYQTAYQNALDDLTNMDAGTFGVAVGGEAIFGALGADYDPNRAMYVENTFEQLIESGVVSVEMFNELLAAADPEHVTSTLSEEEIAAIRTGFEAYGQGISAWRDRTTPSYGSGTYESGQWGKDSYYYNMSNAERLNHPAYQQRAAQITSYKSQIFAQFPQASDWGQFRDLGVVGGTGYTRSDHYWGGALDIGGNPAYLDQVYAWLNSSAVRSGMGIQYILWRTDGHYDHIHVSFLPPRIEGVENTNEAGHDHDHEGPQIQ